MNEEKNTEKNSTLKTIGIVIVLLILLIGGYSLFGNDSGENSVSETTSPSETDNSQTDNSNDLSDVVTPIATTSDEPCLDDEERNEETGECEEKGFGGSDDETAITKLLFPCIEKEKSAGSRKTYLGESGTINGHKKFCWITSFIPEEELTFSIGYMEGCPDGDVGKDAEICTDVNNWREEKRKVPTDKIQSLGGDKERNEGTYTRAGYYGQIIKSNDPNYITSSFFSIVPENPKDLEGLGSYYIISPPGNTVFSIEIDKTAPVIILP